MADRDVPEEITVRLLSSLTEDERADLLAAVQRVANGWAPDVITVASWEVPS